VRLKTFLGTLAAGKKINACDDYWKLIGEKGKVVDDELYNGRVLVLFKKNLDIFEVANHNPIPNSLWIKESDLELDN
jgi:hypothetical protein